MNLKSINQSTETPTDETVDEIFNETPSDEIVDGLINETLLQTKIGVDDSPCNGAACR